MRLYDRLPDHVISNGKKIRLDLDFRNVLRMMDIMGRDDLMPDARDYLALKCICRHPKKGMMKDVKKLLGFRIPDSYHERITDYEQDADLIASAFMQAYGINLFRDKLNWFEFLCFLSCIPEGSKYSDILSIRARPIPTATKYNHDEREWLIKAKADFALKLTEAEEEKKYHESLKSMSAGIMAMLKGDGNNV